MKTGNSLSEVRAACRHFAEAAGPFCHIADAEHYAGALELLESLFEEAEDRPEDPLNAVIAVLSQAIEDYERRDQELAAFEGRAGEGPPELAMLRLLMDQHGLGMADLPEIGSKSMVSRVLSGERGMSKRHIQALAKRFAIDPGLFF
jgi:HTH-type transcriptional regulator / antitoxin HigA